MRTYKKIIKDSSFLPISLYEKIELNYICDIAKRLDNRFAIPATSSNFSIRTKNNSFLITKSGLHKRNLNPSHFIRVNFNGKPLHSLAPKPSDETLLHAIIYRNYQKINAVLHCHAPELENVTLNKTELLPNKFGSINYGFFKLSGHEILKALGIKNHIEEFKLPVIQNDQDIEKISNFIEKNLSSFENETPFCAFLLENHGIYCFGNSTHQAEYRLEAILYHILANSNSR